MFYPLVNERVRMSDCADEFMVFSVDHTACVADIYLLTDPNAIENGVPFRLLFAVAGYEQARVEAYYWEGLLAATREALRSSRESVDRAIAILAEIKRSSSSSMNAVRTSRQLIVASDRVIARARTLDCDDIGEGSNGRPVE